MLEDKLKEILSSYILVDSTVLSRSEMESFKYEKQPNDIDWPFFIHFKPYVAFPVGKILFVTNFLTSRSQLDIYPAPGILYKREQVLKDKLAAVGFITNFENGRVFIAEQQNYLNNWLLVYV